MPSAVLPRGPARGFRPWARAAALAAALALWWPGAAHGQQAQGGQDLKSLFEQVFGARQPTREQSLRVPVIVNGRRRGEAQALVPLENTELLRIEAQALLELIADDVVEAVRQRLGQAATDQGFLTLDALRSERLDADFDEQLLTLVLGVPADLRPRRVVALKTRRPPLIVDTLTAQSDVSSILNVRAGADYVHEAASSDLEGRQPLRLDIEWAANAYRTVIESDASFTEDALRPWQRGDIRLIRDDPERALRYRAGDVTFRTAGFGAFRALGGVSVAREYGFLQPYRITEPLGRHEFVLKRASKVEVLVNGHLSRSLRLDPGVFDIRDFPFTDGINDVRLRISDDVGREEVIDLAFYFDTDLLAPGVDEFSYTVGVPSFTDKGLRKYQTRTLTGSMFHRVGVTETLTAGVNFQGDKNNQLAGAEAQYASPFGNFVADVAVSRILDIGVDYAARLQYQFLDATARNRYRRTFSASLTNRGLRFGALGAVAPSNRVALDASARYSQILFPGLTPGLTGGVGGDYQLARGDRRNTYGINLNLRKTFRAGLSADLSFNFDRVPSGPNETRVFASMTWSAPKIGQSFRISRDTRARASRFDWQYSPEFNIGLPAATASVEQTTDDRKVEGTVRLNGFRSEQRLSHDFSDPRDLPGVVDRRTEARFATALVFADGHFALSRPVNDSFAMVVAHPNLRGHIIGVDRVGEHNSAEVDAFGPAVVPNLASYQLRNVRIEASNLPVGLELGQALHQVEPGFRSGVVIIAGTDATVFLAGVLHDAKGVPIALQAGDILSLDEPDRPPIVMFTNRKGKFRVDGVRPGRYVIKLYAVPEAPVEFVVPESAVGLYDIGVFQIPPPRA